MDCYAGDQLSRNLCILTSIIKYVTIAALETWFVIRCIFSEEKKKSENSWADVKHRFSNSEDNIIFRTDLQLWKPFCRPWEIKSFRRLFWKQIQLLVIHIWSGFTIKLFKTFLGLWFCGVEGGCNTLCYDSRNAFKA